MHTCTRTQTHADTPSYMHACMCTYLCVKVMFSVDIIQKTEHFTQQIAEGNINVCAFASLLIPGEERDSYAGVRMYMNAKQKVYLYVENVITNRYRCIR